MTLKTLINTLILMGKITEGQLMRSSSFVSTALTNPRTVTQVIWETLKQMKLEKLKGK
jgi:hypothetical protein